MVVEILKKKITEFEIEAKTGDDSKFKAHQKLIQNLEKKITDLNAKEIALWESQVETNPANRMPPHIFQTLTAKLEKEREETEIALEKARKVTATPINYEKVIVTFRDALDALLDDNVSIANKNQLLKACISRITYHREPSKRILGKGAGRQWSNTPIDIDVELRVMG